MLALILATLGTLLLFLILLQGYHRAILGRYLYFYCYAASVFVADAAFAATEIARPDFYPKIYWPMQLGTLFFGYGIILEIFRRVLSPYPGVERFARFLGLAILAAFLAFVVIYPLLAPAPSHINTYVQFERSLRAVQAVLLVGILVAISHYEIPLGRNMKGMILGYGLYVGTSLVTLAVRAYAEAWALQHWRYVQGISFDISLVIWLVALWSYGPSPAPSFDRHLDQDYEALVMRTKVAIGALRSYLFKAVRS